MAKQWGEIKGGGQTMAEVNWHRGKGGAGLHDKFTWQDGYNLKETKVNKEEVLIIHTLIHVKYVTFWCKTHMNLISNVADFWRYIL